MALAVVATYFAASRPARSITRIPLVAALSGRPAPPKQVHRSALPGIVLFVVAAASLSYSGKSANGGGAPELVFGIVALIVAIILLAPFCLVVLASFGRWAPIAPRLALRDLARYRARSGSALSAISLGVFIAALVCVLTAQRYGNVLDYAGPNLASNQVIVYTPGSGPLGAGNGPGGPSASGTASTPQAQAAVAQNIAKALGSNTVIELDQVGANLTHAAAGRSWSGPIYVATPQLLQAFGIKASDVNPDADILTARPGLSGISQMQLNYGDKGQGQGGQGNGPNGNGQPTSWPCPKGQCLANPVIQEVGALPAGTSAPNTVITEHAIHTLGLSTSPQGWLIQTPHPPTAAQITNARLTVGAAGMTIETKNSSPSSAEILNYATAFGIALALGILAMTIGLIRSETARDLRTLTATGASSFTRRELTAATAFALALGGAVLGTVAAYVAAIGYAWDNPLDGLSGLSSVPIEQLLFILVGMPVIASVVGWLMAGREPSAISRQPLE
jgi:putative ABC transport system permease protein